MEAHKARAAEVSAAMEQHKEISTLKPVPKGKKEPPLELHPDDFVTIKAHKVAGVTEEPPAAVKVTVDHGTPVDVVKPVNDKTSDSYAAHIEVRPGTTGILADLLPSVRAHSVTQVLLIWYVKLLNAGLAMASSL